MKLKQYIEVPVNTRDLVSISLPHDAEARAHLIRDALACMDSRIQAELSKLDESRADDDLKDFVRQDTLSRHQARRQPYVAALEKIEH